VAQYIVFFNKYNDLAEFDGSNRKCILVGPVTLINVSGISFVSSITADVVTEMVMTESGTGKYRIGSELYTTYMLLSEDVPAFKKLLSMALQGTRVLTFSEYGYLNHVRHSSISTTVGILAPNNKIVETHLQKVCSAKALGMINPTHGAIVIFLKFDQLRSSHIILAHSTPEAETGQEILECNEAWFNYLEETQKLFPSDVITELSYDAFYNLDNIGNC
jgi:hypothetical protein